MRLTLNQSLVLAVIATLLPISALSISQGITSRRNAQQLVRERLVTSALATVATQRDPIALARQMLMLLADDPDVRGVTSRCAEVLAKRLKMKSAVINYARWDAAGAVLCSGMPTSRPISLANEQYWKSGMVERRFTVSQPGFGPIAQRPILVAMLPLFDNRGGFTGAVTSALELSAIERDLKARRLSANAVAMITDARGKPVISSSAAGFPSFDLASSLGTVATIRAADGRRWLYAAAPLFEKQLFVVYAEPEEGALGPIEAAFQSDIVLAISALLMTTLAVWLGMNFLAVRWLVQIERLTKQFTAGNFAAERPQFAKAPAEIAAIGNDLDQMAKAIVERNDRIADAAAVARSLALEVNHRVKNNLQTVISLLELQSAQVRDDAAQQVLQQTRLRINALALVYRLHYDQGEQADRGIMDGGRLIAGLCNQLRLSLGQSRLVQLDFDGPEAWLTVDQAVPMALFVAEAVGNAYRHAFPGGRSGAVMIRLSKADETIEVAISDNGIGYEVISAGTTTMGFDLMQAFTAQLSGRLTKTEPEDGGVVITLSFPAAVSAHDSALIQ